jgi:HEPN domain-containing protein
MTPKRERVFKKIYARELVGIAEGDLESAKALVDANRGRPENICYHAEQCVEKSLKAILVHLEKPVPVTHDLGIITERVNQFLPLEVHADLTLYTEFATTRRYEESDMILDRADLDAAVKIAEDVLAWAKSHIL